MLNILGTIIGLIIFIIFASRTLNDFGYKYFPSIPVFFGEFKKEEGEENQSNKIYNVSSQGQTGGITAGEINIMNEQSSNGGAGGSIKIGGENKGTAIAGKGGGGGPGGAGGIGGGVEIDGNNTGFVMGGEGGEAGQLDRAAKGGRGPLQVLMEDFPEKWKEISKTFGLTEEDAKKYGKGGDGASPTK